MRTNLALAIWWMNEFRSDNATAEAEMALWLSSATTDGRAADGSRSDRLPTLAVAQFTDPVDVFLVRFEYNLGIERTATSGSPGR